MQETTTTTKDPILALREIRERLLAYQFVVANEAQLQEHVLRALRAAPAMSCDNEVIADRNRYDVVVDHRGVRIVLELKVKGSVSEVERQAMRYTKDPLVDAVMVVTTSRRLAHGIVTGTALLGGKPFGALAVRGGAI